MSTEMNRVEIGKKLSQLRGGKTRKEVADSLEISESALAMYESGERTPRDNVKIRLADYYNTTVADLFF